MLLYYKEIGTPLSPRQSAIITGDANTKLNPSVGYDLTLRSSGLYADEGVRNQDDYLYLNPTAASVDDRSQHFVSPAADGNADLIWNKYPNYSAISRWRKMQAVIRANQATGHKTNYDTFRIVGTVSTNGFRGSTLLPNGKVLLFPLNIGYFSIFDPITETFDNFDNAGSLIQYISSASLLPNGKILCITWSVSRPNYILDPITKEFQLLSETYAVESGFGSSILLPNGKTYLVPQAANIGLLMDFVEEKIERLSTLGQSRGGVLLPDGKVLCTPYNTSGINIYDPVSNTYSAFGGLGSTAAKYPSGVLLEDETVLLIPRAAAKYALVNIKEQTIRTFGPDKTISNAYWYGFLLPDGRGLTIPYAINADFALVDTIEETVTNIGFPNTVNAVYEMATLLPDGRIICASKITGQVLIISASDGNYGVLPDLDTCLSAYLNHN